MEEKFIEKKKVLDMLDELSESINLEEGACYDIESYRHMVTHLIGDIEVLKIRIEEELK